MSQRVRRLSAAGAEERCDGDGPEERGGESGGGEKREERRRQAQLLQIHRELQNVEVIIDFLFLTSINGGDFSFFHYFFVHLLCFVPPSGQRKSRHF